MLFIQKTQKWYQPSNIPTLWYDVWKAKTSKFDFFVELDGGVKVLPTQEEGGEYPVRETEEELSQPASLSELRDQIHWALFNPFTAENSSQSR